MDNNKIAYVHLGTEKCASTSFQISIRNSVGNAAVTDIVRNDFNYSVFDSMFGNCYVSDERLSWDPVQLRILIDCLNKNNFTIKPFIVFRNPFKFLSSLYLEAVKWGEVDDFNSFVLKHKNRVDYDLTINQLYTTIKESIEVFELSNSILNDLYKFIGLGMNPVNSYNASLGLDLSGIMLQVNRMFCGSSDFPNSSREVLALIDKLAIQHGLTKSSTSHPNMLYMDVTTVTTVLETVCNSPVAKKLLKNSI